MRPRCFSPASGSLLILLATPSFSFSAPEDRGPYTVDIWDAGSVTAAGVDIPTSVHYPSDAPNPGPIVIVMHGNLRTGDQHTELAGTLASRGFVTLLPDMPCGLGGCNHEANAEQLSDLLDWAEAQTAESQSPIFGLGNGRRGLLGHSYGGLGVFLATALDPSIDAVVLFDPKDDLGAANDRAQEVVVPSLHVMAEVRGLCNDDWGTAVYPDTGVPHFRLRIVGSGHCDAEDPSDALCPIGCGSGDPAKSIYFRRYAVAFMGCVLGRDSSMSTYIGGSGLGDDEAAGLVDQVDHGGLETLPCNMEEVFPDAGGVFPDAGGVFPDAGGVFPDAGGVFPDGGAPITDTGSASGADSGGVVEDAAAGPAPDSGNAPSSSDSDQGCSCRASSSKGRSRGWEDWIRLLLGLDR